MKKSIFESADVGLKKVGAVMSTLALLSAVFSPSLAYAADVREFTSVISPTTSAASAIQNYTLRVTNGDDSKNIKSISIAIPSGFVVSTSTVFATSTDVTDANKWTFSFSSNLIQAFGGGGEKEVKKKEYIDIIFTAEAPASSGIYTWTTIASEKDDLSDKFFTITNTQPTVTVGTALITTTTSVNCDAVDFGSSTTCTTTVTNTSSTSTPIGSVVFSTSGTGNFTPSTSCALSGSSATSSCSVTYEPTTYNSGSQTITADYGGDSSFSSSTGNTLLTINDVNDPVITLVGSSTINLNKGNAYTEQGATASDVEYGDLTGSITSSTAPSPVDTNTPGTYVITYSVSDGSSRTASTTRTVMVNLATTTLTASVASGSPSGVEITVEVNGATSTYTAPIELSNDDIFNATATPVIGYGVTSTGVCSGTATAGGPYVCEFNYVSSSFDITASAGSNGSISPAGVTSVPQGGDQTFTITPASGFQVSDVLVDGSSVGGVTTYTFSSVMASHTIAVSFSAIPPTPPSGGGGGGSVVLVPASNPSGSTTGGGTTGGATGGTTGTGTGTGASDGGNVGGGVGGNVLGDEGAPTGGNNNPPVGGGGGANIGGLAGVIGGGAAEVGGGLAEGTGGAPTSTQLADLASSTGAQASLLASILDTLGGNMNLLILLITIFGILGLIYYFSRE